MTAFALPIASGAQQAAVGSNGKVAGRIIDARTGAGLTDAQLQVAGTTTGTVSSIDGRFYIQGLPAGTVDLIVRRIGYAPKTITGIVVRSGATVEQNVSLDPSTVKLTAQVVTAVMERGSVSAALDRQRTATGIVSSITSEQITKSPDRDAAQAVQRVSGVTVEGGKYVFVRGLGERYTTTSLNGSRMASPEPEKKTVPLDLFPSSLLQAITTLKTFTPDQAGDFSGAAVNLETKQFPTEKMMSYSLGGGVNLAATGRTVLSAPGVGSEWIAAAGSDREVPSLVIASGSLRNLSQSQSNAVVRSFRNVWTPSENKGAANGSFGFTAGGKSEVLGHSLGYIGSFTYGATQEVRADEVRARAVPTSVTEQRAVNVTTGSTGRQSVLLGGIVNLSTLLGQRSKVSLNNMFTRSSDNEAHADSGFLELGTEANTKRSTLTFTERVTLSSQLTGDHSLNDRVNLDWSVAGTRVTRREPDRADLVYIEQMVNGSRSSFALDGGSDDGAKRSFSDLTERGLNAGGNVRLTFGPPSRPLVVKAGGLFRGANRDVIARTYSIFANLTPAQATGSAESIFTAYSTEGSRVFTPVNNSAAGSYEAFDRVSAGYAMGDWAVSPRVSVVAGVRYEYWQLKLITERLFASDHNETQPNASDLLPALALNLKVGETQNLRFSATRTLSRPEYREVSPLLSREVVGEVSTIGNPDLRRALIDNYDVRWEMYPNTGELVSLALFGKNFRQPIERVEVATSGGVNYSFVNADGARNFGAELELRKNLAFVAPQLSGVYTFANTTLMSSTINPGNSRISALTNSSRPMVGQAPYVINTGLTWQRAESPTSATLLFNKVGRRISAAASVPLPDTYIQSRNLLDFSMQIPLGGALAKFNAKNLLDAPVVERQGSVDRLSYRSGRVLSVSLNWQR